MTKIDFTGLPESLDPKNLQTVSANDQQQGWLKDWVRNTLLEGQARDSYIELHEILEGVAMENREAQIALASYANVSTVVTFLARVAVCCIPQKIFDLYEQQVEDQQEDQNQSGNS
jgi:hypothetical protein